MAGSIKFKLVSAPYQEDSGGNGLIDQRQIVPIGGIGHEYTEIDLGAEVPRIAGFTSGVEYSSALRTGEAHSYRLKPDRIGMIINSRNWATPATYDIYKMWQNGKPLAFTPWWDQHTMFCATFGQVAIGAGIMEIGDNQDTTVVPRLAPGDYYQSRFDKNDIGWLLKLLDGEKAKLQPGMIGNSILLERGSANKAVADPTWTAGGNALVKDIDDGNNDMGHTKLYYADGGATGTLTTTVTGLTSSVDYVVSVWAKGHGSLQIGVSGKGFGTLVSLEADRWTRVWFAFTSSATSHDVILASDVGSGLGCLAAFSSLQLEDGDTPTSYMDPAETPPAAADKLKITNSLGRSPDMTIALWLRRTVSPGGSYKYLMSANDGGTDYWILLGATNLVNINIIGSSLSTSDLGTPTGAWEQIVVTRTFDSSTQRLQQNIYHNGALKNSFSTAPPITSANVSTFPNGMYIGSDEGLTSPAHLGADMPIDRFRVDARAWSLQDVEDDYELHRHEGIRAFLAQTAGRFFRFTNIPGQFRGDVDPSALMGPIQLEQIGVNPAGVAQ